MGDLYHVSYRRLVAQVYAFTTDLAEAQDAVQEAFARALARRHTLSDIDAPEAWLRTVAINIVRRRWRRKQILNTIMLRERPLTRMIQEAPEPDRADLRDALATLPRPYREVIVLHYLADLPVDEVAAILEVPVGTVKSRLSRGRDALKGLLDDVEAPPMEQVAKRAGQIRGRRQAVKASAALALVCASAVGFFALRPTAPTQPAATPSSAVTVYQAAGISIHGIFEPQTAPDLPGTIIELDADGRGLLHTDTDTWAKSDDGGLTWEIINDPGLAPEHPQPTLFKATWFAPHPTPSGVLWAAAVINPANPSLLVAYSTDGGSDWTSHALMGHGDLPSSTDMTLTLSGEKVIAIGTDQGVVQRVWEVTTAGSQIVSTSRQGVGVRGEPIALPDGRLLIAGEESQWLLSNDLGATWYEAGVPTDLPDLGELRATSNGYVALDLFRTGWVAISPDGLTWQKLPVH